MDFFQEMRYDIPCYKFIPEGSKTAWQEELRAQSRIDLWRCGGVLEMVEWQTKKFVSPI